MENWKENWSETLFEQDATDVDEPEEKDVNDAREYVFSNNCRVLTRVDGKVVLVELFNTGKVVARFKIDTGDIDDEGNMPENGSIVLEKLGDYFRFQILGDEL